MLIIFDLDDTLIDTSGSITPVKLKQALLSMISAGLEVEDFDEALCELLTLDKTSRSSKETIQAFLVANGADLNLFSTGVQEISNPLLPDFSVKTLDNVHEILNNLRSSHVLCLVTIGKKDYQLQKLEKAGIDRSIFSKIVVSEEVNKRPHYEKILMDFSINPSKTIACGDRVVVDLFPAKELGMKTIHISWGRGKDPGGFEDCIDFSVSQFREIETIINNLEERK